MNAEQVDHADAYTGRGFSRDFLNRSQLFSRVEATRRKSSESAAPVRAYPWDTAARQVAQQILEVVAGNVDEAWAKPRGNYVRVVVVSSAESYDSRLARALGELEARLGRLLLGHYLDVTVELLPSWSTTPAEIEATRLQAVKIV